MPLLSDPKFLAALCEAKVLYLQNSPYSRYYHSIPAKYLTNKISLLPYFPHSKTETPSFFSYNRKSFTYRIKFMHYFCIFMIY